MVRASTWALSIYKYPIPCPLVERDCLPEMSGPGGMREEEVRDLIRFLHLQGYDTIPPGTPGIQALRRRIMMSLRRRLRHRYALRHGVRVLQRIWSDLKRRHPVLVDEVQQEVEAEWMPAGEPAEEAGGAAEEAGGAAEEAGGAAEDAGGAAEEAGGAASPPPTTPPSPPAGLIEGPEAAAPAAVPPAPPAAAADGGELTELIRGLVQQVSQLQQEVREIRHLLDNMSPPPPPPPV
ncbi:uncharacterized protein LOC121395800 [Xenopus laevis]|uniref:Uncharacterized protein LOC121395800 n=1 Tax=Xenopus laevis TaxID=8355 RepID=A0A8J1LBH9_XENLA|nr:uncharacterized protein LOC121395800 [Xenopus laevis]